MEIIETRGDYRVSLYVDDTAGNPREEFDHVAHVVTVPDRSYLPPEKDGGPLAGKWQRCLDNTPRKRDATDLFERYCRTIGVLTLLDTPHDGPTTVWYLMPAEIQEQANHGGDPVKLLEGERDEYRAWAEGSVYGYQIEHRVRWQRTNDDTDTDSGPDYLDTWEFVDGIAGYYGYEDAESEARSALESYAAESTTA